MKIVELDDDLYMYILKNTTYRGESESDILRRLLGTQAQSQEVSTAATAGRSPSEITNHLDSMEFQYASGAVGKFLFLLGVIYQQRTSKFNVVERVKGRGRLYFAREASALNEAGRSVNPKPIPHSPYWVITTTPTSLKQEILADVMKTLNYSAEDIFIATSALLR